MKKKLLLILLLALLLPKLNVEASEYDNYIESVCETYDICPELIEAIIHYESRYQPDVVSKGGCIGLMQINPKWHEARMNRLGVTDLSNAYQNILVGVDYVAELFEMYEDPPMVLDAYSGRLHEEEWYVNNMSGYSKKVLNYSAKLERMHE